jgi:hypothetical protein
MTVERKYWALIGGVPVEDVDFLFFHNDTGKQVTTV